MNAYLLLQILNGAIGTRPKRSRRARNYLSGRGLLSNPGVLMTAAGAAWGVFETLQKKGRGPLMAAGHAPPAGFPSDSVPPMATTDDSSADASALRMIRLAVSAANADGALSERERAAITQQATAAGLSGALAAELSQPQPVATIVAGVTAQEEAATLYVLAYTILRADEQVTGAERIYLAQLAHLLNLDTDTVQALERDTGERIDALGDQGQPGG